MGLNSRATAWKYPQAAQRYVIVGGLQRLAKTTQKRDPALAGSTFDQVYRWLEPFARVSLAKRRASDAAMRLSRVQARACPEDLPMLERAAWRRQQRWKCVSWWVEAWWLDGVIHADPQGGELTAEDVAVDDPEKGGAHFRAHTAYRGLVLEAVELLGDVASTPDRDMASQLYDQAYPYVAALAHPVLLRMPEAKEAIDRLWSDHDPRERSVVTRARRLDAIPLMVEAWYHSGVFGEPPVPLDPESGDKLRDLIPEAPAWRGNT